MYCYTAGSKPVVVQRHFQKIARAVVGIKWLRSEIWTNISRHNDRTLRVCTLNIDHGTLCFLFTESFFFHSPYLISTNYFIVFQAISYAANDVRLRNFKMKSKDNVELPYNSQYSSLEFVDGIVLELSSRGLCELYSEYLDLIEDGKLIPEAHYKLGTNKFPIVAEPVDVSFKLKSYAAKRAEIIADNHVDMMFDHVRLPARKECLAKRYYRAAPHKYEQLIATLDSMKTALPIEYHFR